MHPYNNFYTKDVLSTHLVSNNTIGSPLCTFVAYYNKQRWSAYIVKITMKFAHQKEHALLLHTQKKL